MNSSGNVILVTGGSSGIGRALAQRWHDLGNRVIVTGRRMYALKEAIADRREMLAYELDIDDPAAIQAFSSELISRHPDLNVLVNNAGIMRYEDVTHRRDLSDAEATVVTNLLGPIRVTNAFIDHLVTKDDATIVNVTSGLAFVAFPKAPTYSATKAALHSYTQALRVQLEGRVRVIELAPPAVQTELTPGQATRAGYQPLEEFADEVIALFKAEPNAAEILVERVKELRFAERHDQTSVILERFASW